LTYVTPLAERERIARIMRERYWSDPEFRLRKINRARQWYGYEPYSSVDEIPVRGRRAA
jgi:hypothetical protein